MSRLSEVLRFRSRKKAPKSAETSAPTEVAPKAPIIKKRSEVLDNLPPALKYALQSDRVYRTYPDDLNESDIPTHCSTCGCPFDGPTQSHCRACGGGRSAYKVDVTDNPYYTLPPEIIGDVPKVDPDELIPTFGGGNVTLGDRAKTRRVSGGNIKIGGWSEVRQISGNLVELGTETGAYFVAAKDRIQVYGLKFLSAYIDGGLTAKEIILGSNANVWGKVVIPIGGTLSLKNDCSVNRIIVGANTTVTAEDNLKVTSLIILGPGVKITLGEGCTIGRIESNCDYDMKAGKAFSNYTRSGLQIEYNLILEISGLIKQALSLE